MSIVIKTPEMIEKMRVAGKLAASLLDYITPFVQPGVTTNELDRLCDEYTNNELGSISACLGYGEPPFPKSICTSVNNCVCHGIPNDKPLKEGDIINIDVTIIKDGFHGDTSRMFAVGEIKPFAQNLIDVTHEAMMLGIAEVKPGGHFGDIGETIQKFVEGQGYSVVREYCGHGVGLGFHEEPHVLHYGTRGTGEMFLPGMIFTIEPMINQGGRHIKTLSDQWTVLTKDHSLSAQWEHEVLVTETGHEILTISPMTGKP